MSIFVPIYTVRPIDYHHQGILYKYSPPCYTKYRERIFRGPKIISRPASLIWCMMEFYSQLVGQIYTNKITENDWRFEIWLLFLIYKVKWYFYEKKIKK